MTIKMKQDLSISDQISILTDEIAAKEEFLLKRRAWLHNDFNKRRTTYSAVASDTTEHADELEEMKKQLDGLKKDCLTKNPDK
jgi:hypothetical protein